MILLILIQNKEKNGNNGEQINYQTILNIFINKLNR
jgi:hypothetical protein